MLWLVAEGDTVGLNEPLVEVETAKATVEIPSPFTGTVVRLHGATGEDVPVGAPLVTFEVAGASGGEQVRATPPVRKLAKELGVELAGVVGSGPGDRIDGGGRAGGPGLQRRRSDGRDGEPARHRQHPRLPRATRDRSEPGAAGRDTAGHDVPNGGVRRARRRPARARRLAAPGVRGGALWDRPRSPTRERAVDARGDPHVEPGERRDRRGHGARARGAGRARRGGRATSPISPPRSGASHRRPAATHSAPTTWSRPPSP